MNCKKCKVGDKPGGRVFIDQVFSDNNHVELFCLRCGKRWMVGKDKGAFGAWLTSQVRSIL